MKTPIMDQLFVESYLMLNMEITFAGVREWFHMSGVMLDDVALFQALLQPELIATENQPLVSRLIIYRYEDVFFQVNRIGDSPEADSNPLRNVHDPLHQLLLRLLNTKTLDGEQNAMIDLGLALIQDQERDTPQFPSLHGYFK